MDLEDERLIKIARGGPGYHEKGGILFYILRFFLETDFGVTRSIQVKLHSMKFGGHFD